MLEKIFYGMTIFLLVMVASVSSLLLVNSQKDMRTISLNNVSGTAKSIADSATIQLSIQIESEENKDIIGR